MADHFPQNFQRLSKTVGTLYFQHCHHFYQCCCFCCTTAAPQLCVWKCSPISWGWYELCYQWGSPCQDPAGNWITWRPLDPHKEMQTAVVWSCLPFIGSGQNHLAMHSERGKKTRQTKMREESIRKWTGLELAKSQRTVKNREKLRKLVVKSSVVPKWPSRLRDRWDDMRVWTTRKSVWNYQSVTL